MRRTAPSSPMRAASRSRKVSMRTAGARNCADSKAGTPSSCAQARKCEWKIEPALCPAACSSASPGCASQNAFSFTAT
ncbi:MAG: hypothetical protein DCC72_04665 [Burkholderiales bacterium]|nr:MAG: hypothetical protein DCC72_04665 [Burkholderiales bacterium]